LYAHYFSDVLKRVLSSHKQAVGFYAMQNMEFFVRLNRLFGASTWRATVFEEIFGERSQGQTNRFKR